MSGLIGLELEGCCCGPQPSCMPPFIGGNSCGANLEIELDWSEVKRQQWDNYAALLACSAPSGCCATQGSGCCSDNRAECDPYLGLVGTYCNGGTLPCDHGDVTAQNLCNGCYNNLCNLWVAPKHLRGFKTKYTFRLCSHGYSAQWIAQNLSEDSECIYSAIDTPRQASCNTQYDENTVYQAQSVNVISPNLDECNCTPSPCNYGFSGRSEMTLSNNNAIWRIGGWCTDGGGNVLYPARYKGNGACYTLGNGDCAIPAENICKFDKSYCAMASNNLLPLTEGYTDFATITRTYAMGNLASTISITTAGTGYTANSKVQLVYVSGGSSAPNPYGEPWIKIDSVNGSGGITAISIMTNGAGDKTSIGQVYSVPGGTAGTVTVDTVEPWDATRNPWYRIKLRTIPVEQSQLQDYPNDEALAYTRCTNLLQVTEDLAHYCKYKDCQALPSTDPCPDPCDDFPSVTQPAWLDTNYPGTGFQSDLHFMGRTIQVDGVDVKTPWVTLAFHLKWVLDQNGDLVREEILYHCFGTQKEYETFWLDDSGGAWQSQGTVVANKKKLLWLGLRGDPYNIKNAATGEWYTYGDDHYSECNGLQGIRGTVPSNPFCPGCTVPICGANECLGDNGKWLPDNSDEVRIQSMSEGKVILEGRERYHYKYQVLNYDRSSQTATQIINFENCCSGLFNYAPTGCARVFVKTGLDFCTTCNSPYGSSTCPPDFSHGSTTCDSCCTNSDIDQYNLCLSGPPPLPPHPPYSVPIEYDCENGTPDYGMYATWRNGEARNACLVAGGHTWVLDAMPAVSIYNEALNIPGSMYMAPNNFSSENTSHFYTSQQGGDTCGLPCTRNYGLSAACPEPCGLQDCGYPSLISSYTLPI